MENKADKLWGEHMWISAYANFYSNLKALGVVESKQNIIRKGLVHELLNAQDTVLCSYFAQRSGERDASQSGDRNVEEAFQGLDSFS
jgi:hypothetical protein